VPSSDAILLLIETVDSDDFSLPSDLIVPGKPYALSQGRRFDDPTIIQRFAALLSPARSKQRLAPWKFDHAAV
jgi:hypothetical protein